MRVASVYKFEQMWVITRDALEINSQPWNDLKATVFGKIDEFFHTSEKDHD